MRELGLTVFTSAKANGLAPGCPALLVVETADGRSETLAAEKILITVGRNSATRGLGLDLLDLDMNGQFIQIDDRCRTSMRGVYVINDVTGEPMLAHRGSAQGEMVAELIAGKRLTWDKACIPAICFTDPEVVVAGFSPDGARAAGYHALIGTFPFTANGRAMTTEAQTGFVRVVAPADNHVVLGIQAVGRGVSELAAGFSLALERGARLEDIAAMKHAHPTQRGALQEASMKASGYALHIRAAPSIDGQGSPRRSPT